MKQVLAYMLLISILTSCDNKSCEDILCGINQQCINGSCFCEDGYEGNNCQEIASEKYIGNFNISKSCTQGNGAPAFNGTIQTDGSPVNELIFFNFLGLGQSAFAYIATDQSGNGNYLRFPVQNIGASEIIGEGYYQDLGGTGRLSIDIQLTMNGQVSLCTYTYF